VSKLISTTITNSSHLLIRSVVFRFILLRENEERKKARYKKRELQRKRGWGQGELVLMRGE